jgi:hypothetical protein
MHIDPKQLRSAQRFDLRRFRPAGQKKVASAEPVPAIPELQGLFRRV